MPRAGPHHGRSHHRVASAALLPALALLGGCGMPIDGGALWLAGSSGLAWLRQGGCLQGSQLHGSLTPRQLYAAMGACVRRSDLTSAVTLFSLASAYGRFDAQRVTDPSARQAGSLLRILALQQLNEAQRQALVRAIQLTASDPDRMPRLCAALERIGPPTYHPDYMLRHGLARGRRALVSPFDGDATWQRVLDRDFRCNKA